MVEMVPFRSFEALRPFTEWRNGQVAEWEHLAIWPFGKWLNGVTGIQVGAAENYVGFRWFPIGKWLNGRGFIII